MSIHAQDKKFRLVELPISYRGRPEGSGSKLNTYQDGAGGLRTIVRLFREYRPMEFFGWLGLLLFWMCGLILDVIAKKYRQLFELYLNLRPEKKRED